MKFITICNLDFSHWFLLRCLLFIRNKISDFMIILEFKLYATKYEHYIYLFGA